MARQVQLHYREPSYFERHPTCTHGSTLWEGYKPLCHEAECNRRWWLRYGVWAVLFLVGLVVVGLLWGEQLPDIGGRASLDGAPI